MALKAHVCPTLQKNLLLVYIGGCVSMGNFSKEKWKKILHPWNEMPLQNLIITTIWKLWSCQWPIEAC